MGRFVFDADISEAAGLDPDETCELIRLALNRLGRCRVTSRTENSCSLKGDIYRTFGAEEGPLWNYSLRVGFTDFPDFVRFRVTGRSRLNGIFYLCMILVIGLAVLATPYALIAGLLALPYVFWEALQQRRAIEAAMRRVFSGDPDWGMANVFRTTDPGG